MSGNLDIIDGKLVREAIDKTGALGDADTAGIYSQDFPAILTSLYGLLKPIYNNIYREETGFLSEISGGEESQTRNPVSLIPLIRVPCCVD